MELFRSKVKFPQNSVYFVKKPDNPTKKSTKNEIIKENPIIKPQINKPPEEQKSSFNKKPEISGSNFNNKPVEKPQNAMKTPDKPAKNQEKLIKDAQNAFEAVKNTISLLLEADQEGTKL